MTAAANERAADTAADTGVTWRDGKRYAWLLGLVVPCAPFIALGLVELTGSPVFWWAGPMIIFVLIPLIDVIVGTDQENPPDDLIEWLENDRYYRWVTYLYLPIQYLGLVFACWLWTSHSMSTVDKIGLAVTMGVVAGIGINTAHELGHKKESLERWLSKIALAQAAYGHFFIEHNRGHHVRVATPEDPASARFGETFWGFLPRSVIGSLKSGWHLEKQRLARSGTSPWTLRNDVLNAWAMTIVLFGALAAVFGWQVLPLLAIQAVFGFALLEVVNYLEHYGLLRQKTASGRYERAAPRHSWNSNNVCTNVFLYHLQRHSDHHANPTRRYQALRHFEQAPQLPAGYASMIVMAYFPPVWRAVMDKRLLAHYDGDATLANLNPRNKDKLLVKYGPSGERGRHAAVA
ncbi:alkane 1-monooxygenase [Herbihabitans rhizosphaerae]|uniref:Alkane 1-monooxygenase n=1 Tax=Herbihabitans rhizosphaerae TaxID=1872711 RepID=A0A4Q7KIS2_9PSEU|nr:alkane 1-monooxygenase [Herbihabitans rhizosphaerae]RZS36458.1 alkane 1-monooxygenase [Herbihabitans rhizosphaerae]